MRPSNGATRCRRRTDCARRPRLANGPKAPGAKGKGYYPPGTGHDPLRQTNPGGFRGRGCGYLRALRHPVQPEAPGRSGRCDCRLISTSIAPWNLMPAISAPANSRRTWMSWMVLPVTVLNAQPRLPTMPACSQWEIGCCGPCDGRWFPCSSRWSGRAEWCRR